MPKDRSQMTPENPEDWAEIQSGRRQGTGGTGYDRLAGEQARPGLRDSDPAAETVPEPLGSLTSESDALGPDQIMAQSDAAWDAHERAGRSTLRVVMDRFESFADSGLSLTRKIGGVASSGAAKLVRPFGRFL